MTMDSFMRSIAVPSAKFLCSYSNLPGVIQPFVSGWNISEDAKIKKRFGYRSFIFVFDESQKPRHYGSVLMAKSNSNTIEIQSIITYPDQHGYGSQMMNTICDLADATGVNIWLDCAPYGSDRQHIPLKKLIAFYERFGFARIAKVPSKYVNDYHRIGQSRFDDPMIRIVES